ncbi:SHQ1 protein-domain-containing protein [Chytriomyces sp. MP71]|nr:SHQ1 protein-domain-containing protein [Chytriomyces sp. MP71]
MLTPQFTASQTDAAVVLVIKTPYVKATDVEFVIDKCEFRLHIHPYFLRLTFPCEVVENGKESAKYDVGKGEITVSLPKAVPGEHFPDLDLLTKLLMPRATAAGIPSVAHLQQLAAPLDDATMAESTDSEGKLEGDEIGEEEDEEFDWEMPQELPQPDILTGIKYGFNNAYSGFAAHVAELGRDIIDIDNIDASTPASRREERIAKENLKFDEDYYMSDYMHDEEIRRLIKFKPTFWATLKRVQQAKGKEAENESSTLTPLLTNDWLTFTQQENSDLISLPHRKHLLDPTSTKHLYLGLIDILFTFAYDHRTTEADPTAESAWTLAKLSPTLACFETFATLEEVLVACTRRALAYPLYRHYALMVRVWEDVSVLLKLGKCAVMKALLGVRRTLRGDEACFVFDRLYVEDYCLWVQSDGCHEKVCKGLGSEVNHFEGLKGKVGWDLVGLEALAKEIGDGEEDEEAEEAQMLA